MKLGVPGVVASTRISTLQTTFAIWRMHYSCKARPIAHSLVRSFCCSRIWAERAQFALSALNDKEGRVDGFRNAYADRLSGLDRPGSPLCQDPRCAFAEAVRRRFKTWRAHGYRAAGVYLDYSKNRITDETLSLLLQLANESGL